MSFSDEKTMMILASRAKTAYGKKLANAELFIISDLDGTLLEGNDTAGLKEFTQWITEKKAR